MTMSLRPLALAALLTIPVAAAGAAPSRIEPSQPGRANEAVTAVWSPAELVGAASLLQETGAKGAVTDYYVVLLEDEPLALYGGDVPGLEPTNPSVTGTGRLDLEAPRTMAYLGYLDSIQGQMVTTMERELGRAMDVKFRYQHAINGMSVRLTPEEADRVARMPGVRSVTPNTPQPLDTDSGPRWIGAVPVWDGSALGREAGTMGEGMVVGVIDTGINIDHPSFAEVDKNGYEHLNPRGHYFGFCDPAHARYDAKWKCNQKLIGLYSFLNVSANPWNPEDDHGHGSHTASTAAGNFVTAPFRASNVTLDLEVSGVAPHANIIAYDACYATSNGLGGCPPDATLAALNQALRDGVDVVNYSISSSKGSPWEDPHMLAFRSLRTAGVFAAVSAGNEGPTEGTTAAIAPWITAVAATTNDRTFVNRLTGMSGGNTAAPADIVGKSLTAGVGPVKIVFAGDGSFKNASGNADDGSCSQAFPARTFSGQIVVCDRTGNTARLQRAANVRAGGAGGMVLANTSAQGAVVYSDAYALPGLHISHADGVALKAWLASGNGHVATIEGSRVQYSPTVADQTAGFSSRGPARSETCCRRPDLPLTVEGFFPILKPDLAAPGAQVFAAVASGGSMPAPEFAAYDGTSMSSPHVAGAAALVMAARPDWSPAEVQSALMSTAAIESLVKEDGRTAATAFDVGAGRIDIARAVNAGLLWNVTPEAYAAADPKRGGDPSSLNLPSLYDSACLDRCTFRRTVRSPLSREVTWTAGARLGAGASGMGVQVRPGTFTLAPGDSQEIEIEVDAKGLKRSREDFAFASVMLTPDDAAVSTAHMPLAVLPIPSTLSGVIPIYTLDRTGHQVVADQRAAEIRDLQVGVRGLTRGKVTELALAQDPNPNDRLGMNAGKALITVTVPANARRIVAEVVGSTSKDIDMVMGYDANKDGKAQNNEAMCVSFGESYREFCEVVAVGVPASTFWVVLQNFTASDNAPDSIQLVTAAVPDADAGNLTVTAPDQMPFGSPFDLDLAWDLPDLRPGDRWYGLVELGSSPSSRNDIATFMIDLIGREPPPTPTPSPTTAVPATATPKPNWAFKVFLPRTVNRWPALETPVMPTAAVAPRH